MMMIIIIIIMRPLLSNLGTSNRITPAFIFYIICHPYIIMSRCLKSIKTASTQSASCTSSLLSSNTNPLYTLTDMCHSYLQCEAQYKHFGSPEPQFDAL